MSEFVSFSAGPSKLPAQVLKQAQEDIVNFAGTGESILETPHRSGAFSKVVNEIEVDSKKLLGLPDNYRVLLLPAGARGQFDAIPMNLGNLAPDHSADYLVTGSWSIKAAKDAEKHLAQVNYVVPKREKFNTVEPVETWNFNRKSSYFYYCSNETIEGLEIKELPETNGVPIVCDMSSNIMTQPLDVTKFGMIFGGAQKLLGCAGVTYIIIREDLIGHAASTTPGVLDYRLQAGNNSAYNTPPVFNIRVLGLTLKWILAEGGLTEMSHRAEARSTKIYDTFKNSNDFYYCPTDPKYQSRTNIPFRVGGKEGNDALEKLFLKEADAAGLRHLKGHRTVGGLRASLYNSHTIDEATRLAEFMEDFMIKHEL